MSSASRSSTTPARRRAASTRPPTAASRGIRSSTTNRCTRSATSRWRRRIRAPCGPGTGEACIRSHISVGEGIYKSTDAGTHVGAHGPRADRPHRQGHRASEESRRRARVRARSRLRAATGTRRLSHRRRRQELGARAVRRREHRLLRARHGSDQPAQAVRGHVAGRHQDLGPRERRSRQRPVHVERRRHRPGRGCAGKDCRRARSARSRSRSRRRTPIASTR